MHLVTEANFPEVAGKLREQARWDAETLIPRPLGAAADLPEVVDGELRHDAQGPSLAHERLPFGDADVLRRRVSWAARLPADPSRTVTVTVAGRHVAPTTCA